MAKERTYHVPMAVAATLNSGRNTFTEVLAKSIETGDVTLEKEEVAEILCLVGDLVEKQFDLQCRNHNLIEAMNEFNALNDSLHNLRKQFNEIRSHYHAVCQEQDEGDDS